MFFIIAVIAFIVAVIALIVYLVQMRRTKEHYLGKDAVDAIARQAAEKARREDVTISCDYCGAKIDTAKHKICPQCGAPYGKDKEWLERHKIDEAAMNKQFEAGFNRNKKKVQKLNSQRMRRVRLLVICISAAIVFVAMIIVLAFTSMRAEATKPDVLPEGYVKTDYQFTEPLLYEDENLKLELGDIYRHEDLFLGQQRYDYDIEVKITNKTGKQGKIDLNVAAANNKCIYSSIYGEVGTKKELLKLLEIRNYYLNEEYLKTLSIDRIDFRDKDYNPYYQQTGIKTVETTADYVPGKKKPEGDVLFEKNGLVFSVFPDQEKPAESAWLQITNTGSYDYQVRTYASLVNGQTNKLWIDATIPVGCQSMTDYVYKVYLKEGEKLEEAKIQFECECSEHPEQNFVTEYLVLPLPSDKKL